MFSTSVALLDISYASFTWFRCVQPSLVCFLHLRRKSGFPDFLKHTDNAFMKCYLHRRAYTAAALFWMCPQYLAVICLEGDPVPSFCCLWMSIGNIVRYHAIFQLSVCVGRSARQDTLSYQPRHHCLSDLWCRATRLRWYFCLLLALGESFSCSCHFNRFQQLCPRALDTRSRKFTSRHWWRYIRRLHCRLLYWKI